MKRGQAGWRGARTALSLVVAMSMALAGWPVPALEALADEAEAVAEEQAAEPEPSLAEQPLSTQDNGDSPAGDVVDYERENDRDMLRGWGGDVNGEYNVYVENAAFPDGEDLRYTVTDVAVVSQEPADGDPVVGLKRWDDGNGWHYDARNFGTATIKVTYQKPAELGGGEGSYTFNVRVDDVVYDLSIRTSTGSNRLLPGESVGLKADCRRMWEDPQTGDRGEDSDGLSVSWEIAYTYGDLRDVAESVASIDQSGRLTACALSDGVHGVWQFVGVRATLTDANDPEARISREYELVICDDYHEVWPPVLDSPFIDSPFMPGTSQTITPEVRHYALDLGLEQKYEVIPGVAFAAENVDTNCVAVRDNQDGTFTITRRDRYETNFTLMARWGDDLEKPCWYHLDNVDCGMWFKEGDRARLYSDGTIGLELEGDDGLLDADACAVEWSVGVADDRGDFIYDNATGEDARVFSVEGNRIVLDGAKCLANDEIRAHGGINVCARAKVGGVELADAWCWVELREARVDYQRENDRDMLRGWGGDVNGEYNVYVENAQNPDGEDLRYTVTDVEVVSQEPADGDPVVELTRWDDGNGWHYDARNFGTATIRVTYQDPAELGGGTGSYTFDVRVDDDVYDLDVWSEGNVRRALPGRSIVLHAQGVHHSEGTEDVYDGFGYEWSLGENAGLATLRPNEGDPRTATLTFNELPAGQDGIWEDVQVEVRLAEGGEERAYADRWYTVADDFCAIEPAEIDRGLDVGASTTITPEVHRYRLGAEGYEVIDAKFERWDYDGNLFGITDNGDGSFTITRLGNWDGQANLHASWEEHGEGRDEWASYRLDRKDYDAWFEWDEDATATEEDEHGHWVNPLLYSDWTTTLTLNTEKLATVPDYHIQSELMLKGKAGGEEQVVPLERGYTIDGNTITFDGATVNQIAQNQQWEEVWGVDLCFRVMYGSDSNAVKLCEARKWVRMRDGCEDHVWSGRTITEAACEQPGSRKQTCETCDEVRLVSIPAKGHTLDAVAAKPATLTATGTKAHYKCSVCHKLFSDAAGTNEVTAASLTIAKLVNIAGAKVTVASKAYTGKAQTSAPVVKLGGKTLRAGVDYTVTGNQGTNAGSYVVTITGKGAYGGTAKGTFVITKIASAMTVKATKKKVKIADVSKKSQKVSGALTVEKQSGKVTYALNKKTKKAKATKKFKISSKGVVTVPKRTAKGKYSLKINVKDAGDINHAAKTKTVTLVITVK